MNLPRGLFFLSLLVCAGFVFAQDPEIEVSTATGHTIQFDDASGVATIEGDAHVYSATATLTADKISVNTKSKSGIAEGNVKVIQGSSTITGSEARYNWETSTGTMMGATGVSLPWRFAADQMVQKGAHEFELSDAQLTSCDANPPHYYVRASHGNVITGKRAKMKNASFMVDDLPAFWTPFYRRSLVPKKYSLRIEPGQSGRDGLIFRNTLGYPFTANSYTKFKWDYLQRTGDGIGLEHRYFNPNIRGSFDTYYIHDINPDPAPQTRRFSADWDHYQRLTRRLTMNTKVNYKSDQTFGNNFENAGNGILVESDQRGMLSEGGFNYQFPRSALEAQFTRNDKFDSTVSSKSYIAKIVLPSLTYTTVPLKWRYFPFYTNFTAQYLNETGDRTISTATLRYQRSASVGAQVRKDLRLSRRATFTPRLGYTQAWQDRRLTGVFDPVTGQTLRPDFTKDIYVGRYNTGADTRLRVTRTSDLTLSYSYVGRNRPNNTRTDTDADDHGIETNALSGSVVKRVGRSTRLSLGSGYDFRQAPKSAPAFYPHRAKRFTPPSLDLQWQATQKISVFYRETYSISPKRVPENTSGEIQYGSLSGAPFFSQGFTWTRQDPTQKSVVDLTNKVRMYLTPKWYVDLFLTYRGFGTGGLNYTTFRPTEKTIRVARDLHCWVVRGQFTARTDRTEVSFYIDLKANLASQKGFANPERAYDSYQREQIDVSQIFPAGPTGEPAAPASAVPVAPVPATDPLSKY